MAEKRRYTVSLPDHVADRIESYATKVSATPTEYAADILRWWFGQGCPPVTPDELQLRKRELAKRILPVPPDLNVWHLDKEKLYQIDDDNVVKKLLGQLGVPNLFAHAAEHDQTRLLIAFDNHPTHWLVIDLFKGSDRKDGDGLLFRAYPKMDTSRKQMLDRLAEEGKEMETNREIKFSQIPAHIKTGIPAS